VANNLLQKKIIRKGAKGSFNVPRDFSPEGKRFAQSVVDNLQQLTGEKGDDLDRAVTFNDLINAGIAKKQFILTGGGSNVVIGKGDEEGVETPTAPTGASASGAFQNILISWDYPSYAGHSHTEIYVHSADNFSQIEIDKGRLSPKFLGQTTASVFSHQVGNGANKYYWIRHVNRNDVAGPTQSTNGLNATTAADVGAMMALLNEQLQDLPGFTALNTLINNSAGTAATIIRSTSAPTTRSDGSDLQANDIWVDTDDNNQLYVRNADNDGWEETRDGTLVTLVNSINTTVGTNTTNIASASSDIVTLTTANAARASEISTLQSTINDSSTGLAAAHSAIESEATTRANADSANSTSITNLTAKVNTKNKSFVQDNAPANDSTNDLKTGDLWIDSNDDNKLYRWDGSSWNVVRDTSNDGKASVFTQDDIPTSGVKKGDLWFDTNDSNKQYRAASDGSDQVTAGEWELVRDVTTQAAVNTEATARADADSAIATDITNLTATVGSNTSSITTISNAQSAADGRSGASYVLQVNTNGHIAGFVVQTSASASGQTTSDVIFQADRFRVVGQSGSGVSTPFTVVTNAFTQNGETVPAGTYIDTAFIQKGSITNALIGDATIDNAKITNTLDASKIVAGQLNADRIQIDNVTLDTDGQGNLIIGTFDGTSHLNSGTIGLISGTAGNDVTMTSVNEISQANFVNSEPKHIAAANHSDNNVSAGDVMGGSPLFQLAFTTPVFTGTKTFLVQVSLDPIGSFGSSSSSGFAFAMKATTSATDFTSTTPSHYVTTRGTSIGGSNSGVPYFLTSVVSLNGNTSYYIWVFGVYDDVSQNSSNTRGIRDGAIQVIGLAV